MSIPQSWLVNLAPSSCPDHTNSRNPLKSRVVWPPLPPSQRGCVRLCQILMAILTKVGVFRSSWADKGPRSGSAQETPQTPSPQKSLQRVCRESAESPQRVRRESVQETRKGPHKGPHFVGLGLFPSYNKSIRITTQIILSTKFQFARIFVQGSALRGFGLLAIFFPSPDHRKNVHAPDEVLVCEGFRPPIDHPSGVGFKDGHLLPPPPQTRGGGIIIRVAKWGHQSPYFFLVLIICSKKCGILKDPFPRERAAIEVRP